ncbi:MAG: cupin domain-containing protein [Sphingomonadaceae bacterium]
MSKSNAESAESYYLLGETLRPLLTNAMGSSFEVFDTTGTPGGGPPPHTHPWEEAYFVLSGEMDVHIDGATTHLAAGDITHVPAGVAHGYTTLDETHFLTIVTKGNASKFFKQVSTEIEMSPPDIEGILRVGEVHGATFLA